MEAVNAERKRLYAPLERSEGISWKELTMAISKAMQNYCGGVKCDALLHEGLDLLESFETEIVPQISCKNPHELMRAHEVFDSPEGLELLASWGLPADGSLRGVGHCILGYAEDTLPEPKPRRDNVVYVK